jgi:hypothetical protein
VTIAEDEASNFDDNYTTKEENNSIIISPKIGKWERPFFGIPRSEFKEVSGSFGPFPNPSGQTNFEYFNVTLHDGSIIEMVYFVRNEFATAKTPFVFRYLKKPSVISFGDRSDTTKTWVSQ